MYQRLQRIQMEVNESARIHFGRDKEPFPDTDTIRYLEEAVKNDYELFVKQKLIIMLDLKANEIEHYLYDVNATDIYLKAIAVKRESIFKIEDDQLNIPAVKRNG